MDALVIAFQNNAADGHGGMQSPVYRVAGFRKSPICDIIRVIDRHHPLFATLSPMLIAAGRTRRRHS